MGIVKITYRCIDPSENEVADYCEEGWIDEEGSECETVAEALKCIQQHGYVEGDSSGWFSTIDADIDWHTGIHTYYDFHLSGFTDEELNAIDEGIKR